MAEKQNTGVYAPDGSLYITLTDGEGNLTSANQISSDNITSELEAGALAATTTSSLRFYDEEGNAYDVPAILVEE